MKVKWIVDGKVVEVEPDWHGPASVLPSKAKDVCPAAANLPSVMRQWLKDKDFEKVRKNTIHYESWGRTWSDSIRRYSVGKAFIIVKTISQMERPIRLWRKEDGGNY